MAWRETVEQVKQVAGAVGQPVSGSEKGCRGGGRGRLVGADLILQFSLSFLSNPNDARLGGSADWLQHWLNLGPTARGNSRSKPFGFWKQSLAHRPVPRISGLGRQFRSWPVMLSDPSRESWTQVVSREIKKRVPSSALHWSSSRPAEKERFHAAVS